MHAHTDKCSDKHSVADVKKNCSPVKAAWLGVCVCGAAFVMATPVRVCSLQCWTTQTMGRWCCYCRQALLLIAFLHISETPEHAHAYLHTYMHINPYRFISRHTCQLFGFINICTHTFILYMYIYLKCCCLMFALNCTHTHTHFCIWGLSRNAVAGCLSRRVLFTYTHIHNTGTWYGCLVVVSARRCMCVQSAAANLKLSNFYLVYLFNLFCTKFHKNSLVCTLN